MSDHIADRVARLMRDLTHGRTIAPTIAEAAKHDGAWLVHFDAMTNVQVVTITAGLVRCDGFVWPLAEFVAANPASCGARSTQSAPSSCGPR